MSKINVKEFVKRASDFSHLYIRCNNTNNHIDVITVGPLGSVDRLCVLDIVNGKVDYTYFMNILKKSIKTDLQRVYDCTR